MNAKPIQWYLTAPQDCPYLEGRETRSLLVDPAFRLDGSGYGELLERGFRRSGRFVYRHQCAACTECVAVRVPVAQFRPNRSQRRCLRRNADLEVGLASRWDLAEHVDLLARYLQARHAGGGMDETALETYRDMLDDRHGEVRVLESRLQGKLLAVAITDQTPRGLSAVYTFFDTSLPARGLGNFSILQQIRETTRLGLPHLYLGYWIPGSPKMGYKSRFRPIEGLVDGVWQGLDRSPPCGKGDEALPGPAEPRGLV
jgi:leucyl-tRNA---protein transferase